jgi:hypothetical protein
VSGSAREARPLSLAEAVDALRAPDATERWSPLGADRALVIDLGGASRVASAAGSLACEVLASLPCPSIAFGPAELAP